MVTEQWPVCVLTHPCVHSLNAHYGLPGWLTVPRGTPHKPVSQIDLLTHLLAKLQFLPRLLYLLEIKFLPFHKSFLFLVKTDATKINVALFMAVEGPPRHILSPLPRAFSPTRERVGNFGFPPPGYG